MYKNKFLRKVKDYIEAHNMLSIGDSVVMGVSGGADSVALFFVLLGLREELDLNLSVVHVNHGLREEASEEASYVEDVCKDNDVHFFLKEIDVAALSKEMGKGTEETGRIMRYRFFEEIAGGSGKIAVAHNMNDLAETMLFNLCRGTGPKGLAGIRPVRGNIIRPLLCVSRAEIEEYLASEGRTFYTDKSNLTDDYTRNRIRNNILPLMEREVEKQTVPHMFETAGQLSLLNDFATGYMESVFEKIAEFKGGQVSFSRRALVKEHPYIRAQLYKHAIDLLVPGNRDITSTHILSVDDIVNAEGNREIDLPYGIKATTVYDSLDMLIGNAGSDQKPERLEPVELMIPGETNVPGFGKIKCTLLNLSEIPEISRKEYTKCLDYDRITRPLLIRNRQSGDMITVTENGHKKLKDFLIDCKVERNLRDSLPVIASGSDIVWIPGLRLSEAYKVREDTRKVLVVDIVKEDLC